MSQAPAAETAVRVKEPEVYRPLTPDASNILGWWWLAIAFTVLLLWAIWPSLFPETTSSFGTYLLIIISAGFIALAAWCAIGFRRAEDWSVGAMRMTAIVSLVVGLLAIIYFLYAVAFAAAPAPAAGYLQSPGFFGPSVLSIFLWVILIILPFIFGLLVIFGLMTDAVEEWLHPPIPEPPTAPNLKIDPATAAMMATSGGGSPHGVTDEALMSELSQVMTVDAATRRGIGATSEHSVEVIGSRGDDLSVEVVGGDVTQDEGSIAELAALEQALSEDAKKKKKGKKKKDDKMKPSRGDDPLSVDDDFKL